MDYCSSTERRRQPIDSSTSSISTHNISDPNSECAKEQGNEETPGPEVQPPDVSSSSGPATYADEGEGIVITSIQGTDLALGLRRIPAGFHAVVHHSNLEWRTENKPVSVDNDVVEWHNPISIPSDLSATVSLAIYASFESQPMLGNGEQLRTLTAPVGELLDRSVKNLPFTFFPRDGDVISPCSSLLVTVNRQNGESNGLFVSRVLDPHCSTAEPRGQLEDATDQGHSALSYYRKQGEERDLQHAIEHFERALNICPLDHHCRAVVQSNMAMAKLIYCQVHDTDASLDVSLILYRNALVARPVGHPDRVSTLIQLVGVHLARLRRKWDGIDAAQVAALLREAMELSPSESHEHRAAMLTVRLHTGCETQPVPVRVKLFLGQDSTPESLNMDPLSLGVALVRRFERFGRLADIQRAILVLDAFIRTIPIWSHRYSAGLTSLSVALVHRFKHLGELSDLEDAISRQRAIITLTPDGHPDKSLHLSNLGISLITRFERLGEPSDLNEAISKFGDAADLTPDARPDKPGYLKNLGISFMTRFQYLGELSDLEEAISRQRDAVALTPDGHPDKPRCLNSLGSSFGTRFQRLGELGDLEEAIARQRGAVSLTPDDHPDKPEYLNNLGTSFRIRFQRLGELKDLEDAVSRQRDAVGLIPDGHPDKPRSLNNLGSSLRTRFQRLGELNDLEEAISRQRDSVDLTPDGHLDKPRRLGNLGTTFMTRFERFGELNDLEEAILRFGDAVDLIPNGHPDKPRHLSNLGISISARFGYLEELNDLEKAISRQQDAVCLTPDDHPDKPQRLSNLGSALLTRFKRLGELNDLEEAISRFGDAVSLIPDGHSDKPGYLNNLGVTFFTRFQRIGELSDLEEAISRQQDAVGLLPDGHPDKPLHLSNLGTSLRTRFERLGELSDVGEAISRQREAVGLIPNGHPEQPQCLSNLGISFIARFKCLGELSDLEEAILRQRDAAGLVPDSHPDNPGYLNNLAISLFARFQRLGEPSDLENAISKQRDAISLTPNDHPDKSRRLNGLCSSLIARFERLKGPCDLKQVLVLSSAAACATGGPASVRFQASRTWIRCARRLGHHSLLHAYSVAVGLLPQLAWIGHSFARRFRELVQDADVVLEAAAAALDSGHPETAIEWLEQGRSIVWGELFQLRSSYDELSSVQPDHARRLRELSAALEHASTARENLSSFPSEQTAGARNCKSLQEEADRHRKLAIERDRLLQDIRKLPGFERFLLQKDFPQLRRTSAHSGPVVILNAAETRCDALIVLAEVEHVIHVPLPNFTLRRCKRHRTALQSFIRQARGKPCDDRVGRPVSYDNRCEPILSTLWKDVVRPVLEALALSIPGDCPSRIFWCPTGPFTFFPIHAAGDYDSQTLRGHKVFDYVVSSYIPTLSILASSPKSDDVPGRDPRLLAVSQPLSDGQCKLPGVTIELEHLRAVIKNSPSTRATLTESSVGTVEEVLTLMKEADWVHFACHGVQDATNPTESGLCLANRRRLRISDIIALSRTRGGLAFLSACQTAQGDEDLSDEAIHVAAGMLFAGYGGVIGTMWSISDRVAPDLAKDVYEQLFQDHTTPDYRDAAQALHHAVARLRDKNMSFSDWLPFIHVGL